MAQRINYLWRLAVTGLCFALFGVSSALFTLLVLLPIYLFPGSRTQRHRRAQMLIQRSFALLIGVLRLSGVMRLELRNAELLRNCGNVLVFANHPSYLDIVVILSQMPRSTCIVNSRLWRSPFYGGIVRSAGYIRNDTPETLVHDCVSALDNGAPLIIFPEGTRSQPDEPLRMMRGAAHIVLNSRRDILPVILSCNPRTLGKGTPWYRIPERAFHFVLDVRPALTATQSIDLTDPPGIAARKLTLFLETYFTKELHRYA